MKYYTYAYLREDGTPYYIGKGTGRRAYAQNHRINLPKCKDNIIILKYFIEEAAALSHEEYMIYVLGRKDIGTGILQNLSSGGTGGTSGYKHKREECNNRSTRMAGNTIWSGRTHSQEAKDKVSAARKGKPLSQDHIEKLKKSHSKVEWRVRDPEGNFTTTYNLTDFCRGKNISASALYNYGKTKGWTARKVVHKG